MTWQSLQSTHGLLPQSVTLNLIENSDESSVFRFRLVTCIDTKMTCNKQAWTVYNMQQDMRN